MRWAIIGHGDMAAKTTVPSIRAAKGADLVAVCGRDRGRAHTFATRFDIPGVYDDIHELARDGGVDAVFISTPPGGHGDQAVACLEAKKHVLCEKPMAIGAGDCLRMVDAAEENDRLLGVAYYRRSFPHVLEIKKLIDEGAIGRLVSLQFHFGMWYRPEKGAPGTWRLDPVQGGGGALQDVGSHRIDLVRYLGGEFGNFSGMFSRAVEDWPVEDTASVLIELRNGAHAAVQSTFSQDPGEDRFSIHGTEGSIVVDDFNTGTLVVSRKGKWKETRTLPPPREEERHRAMIENLQAAAKGEAPLLCPAQEGLEVTRVIETVLADMW